MFAGEWRRSFMAMVGKELVYELDSTHPHGDDFEVAELKKAKNVTLVKEVKNLHPPLQDVNAVLVVDFIDRSLYLQVIIIFKNLISKS